MISILIPIYNVDVTELVHELAQQALSLRKTFEIICIDDASDDLTVKNNNRKISSLELVQYSELDRNIGRGSIRMRLAESANFDTLLFLDCDMRVTSNDYLKRFLKHEDKKVVIGGITYPSMPPKNQKLLLRWKYGILREKKSASERNRMRFSHFMASNLLIKKKIFLALPVDEDIVGYGHEDTLLGLKLLKLGTPLSHIDNPLEHLGLDSATIFLQKSKSGTSNLAVLYSKRICGPEIRLISLYERLSGIGLAGLAYKLIKPFIPLIEQNLMGPSPAIRFFDIWKLYHFMSAYRH